jgi:hypothetical protein
VLTACESHEGAKQVLKDLTYESNKEDKSNYTVYIKENTEYIPYLVLCDDYNGNVLLIREKVISEMVLFNEQNRYSGYYENSLLDTYLNEEFIEVLDENLKTSIVTSEILITSKDKFGEDGILTNVISRNIFTLAYSEVKKDMMPADAYEGEYLPFFENTSIREATDDEGMKKSWWLRSSSTWYDDVAMVVGMDGVFGESRTDAFNGVRPAFCLKGDVLIELKGGLIADEQVYVLAIE